MFKFWSWYRIRNIHKNLIYLLTYYMFDNYKRTESNTYKSTLYYNRVLRSHREWYYQIIALRSNVDDNQSMRSRNLHIYRKNIHGNRTD